MRTPSEEEDREIVDRILAAGVPSGIPEHGDPEFFSQNRSQEALLRHVVHLRRKIEMEREWLAKAVAFVVEEHEFGQILIARRTLDGEQKWVVIQLVHRDKSLRLTEKRLVPGFAEYKHEPWWREKITPFGWGDDYDDLWQACDTKEEAFARYELWVKQGRKP